jgi:zona occludens toxin (predicted ATPase)
MKINKDYMQIMRAGKLNTYKQYQDIRREEKSAYFLVVLFAIFTFSFFLYLIVS